MEKNKLGAKRLQRRKYGIRKSLFGTAERPRLTIFRSNKHIYAQVINDFDGRTLASASTVEKDIRSEVPAGGDIAAASAVGKRIAEKAKAAGVSAVAFDRNGRKYHGRIKALADSAREGGLQF